jgi:hypothetical protein
MLGKLFSEIFMNVSSNISVKYLLMLVQLFSEIFTDKGNNKITELRTEYGTALTTILPILFLYLNTVTVTAGTFEP